MLVAPRPFRSPRATAGCQMESFNPCTSCGACCAMFRATFHWSEAEDGGGTVPVEMTVDIDSFRRAMLGTERRESRCVALEGEIGTRVRCTIYERRPSVCREFPVSWEDGTANDKCDRARQRAGLPPLAADWLLATRQCALSEPPPRRDSV